MNRNTRILAILFAAVIGYAFIANFVYPSWIAPLLTLDQRVASKEKELGELLKDDEKLDQARNGYRTLVGRIGSFNVGKVETDVRSRLVALIEKYHLEDANVSPSRPSEDRKTGLTTDVVTVSAVGSLDSAIHFLREAAELPHLSRVGNVSISPVGGFRKGTDKEQVSFRAPIELLILPKSKVVGPIDEATLTRAENYPRHANQEYSKIWKDRPFWDYVPPIPLQAHVAKPSINVEIGTPVTLEGEPPTGGDGQYTIHWSPPEGLSDPSILRPTLDTSKPMANKPYTLTVADGTGGAPATARVTVTVHEPAPPPQPVAEKPKGPPPPPPPPPIKTWPDDKLLQLCMTLMRRVGDNHVDEVMVSHTRTKENKYYKAGDDFDGGKLIFVHQRGALVHRRDGYLVYPLGGMLDAPLPVANANEFPELQEAAEKHKALMEAESQSKRASAAKPATTPEAVSLDEPSTEPRQVEPTSGTAAEPHPQSMPPGWRPLGGAVGMPPATKIAAETATPRVNTGAQAKSAAPVTPHEDPAKPVDTAPQAAEKIEPDVPSSPPTDENAAPTGSANPADEAAGQPPGQPASPSHDDVAPNPGRKLPPRARPWKQPQKPQPAGKP